MQSTEAVAILRPHGTVSRRGDTYRVNLLHGGGARLLSEQELCELATAAEIGNVLATYRRLGEAADKEQPMTPIEQRPAVEAIDAAIRGGDTAALTALAQAPESAAARLRLRGFSVRPQIGDDSARKWIVRQSGHDRTLALSAADLALAATLAQEAPDGLTIDDLLSRLEAATAEPAGTAMVPAAATIDGIVMMGEAEARACVGRIQDHLEGARRELIDLEDREGWKALGYDSWRACVTAEFGQSQAYLYRQLTAAKIERELDSPIGEIPESHLRPLSKLDTPDERRDAWQRATELANGGKRTAQHVQQAVEEIKAPAADDSAFKDARTRFAALGYKLERHGVWFKLSTPSGNHYATTQELAPQLATLKALEDGQARRETQEAQDAAASAPAPPAIPPDIRSEAARLGLVVEPRDGGILLYWPDEADDLDGVISPVSEEEAREWLSSDALTQYERRQAQAAPPPAPQQPPAPPCEHCGKPATEKRNIAGTLAWRCEECAVEQFQADVAAQQQQRLARCEECGALLSPRAAAMGARICPACTEKKAAPTAVNDLVDRAATEILAANRDRDAYQGDPDWIWAAREAGDRLNEAFDMGEDRATMIRLALELADAMAGDDLGALAADLDDATYEALAAYRQAKRGVPTLEEIGA